MKRLVSATVTASLVLVANLCPAQQGPAQVQDQAGSPPPFVKTVEPKDLKPDGLDMPQLEGDSAGAGATQAPAMTPKKKLSPEELIESWMIENGQVDKAKAKARTYQEHIEKEVVPKGRVRTVYTPLDEAEIPIKCSVNYSTLIRLPGTLTEKDIAMGNKERFGLEIYQDGRTLVLYPKMPFKATNVHLMLDGGNKLLHLLLEENGNRTEVDYQVNIMFPPTQGPDPGKLMRWISYDKLPANAFEVSGGMGASLTKVNKKLGSGITVIRRLEVNRPERMVGYALQIPSYSKDSIKPIDAAYHGELSAGEYFVFYRHPAGKIEFEGRTYVLP